MLQKPCTKRLTLQTQPFPFYIEWCLKTKIPFPSLLLCHALGILVIEGFSLQSTLHMKRIEQLGTVTNILWETCRQKNPATARESCALSSWMSLRRFQINQPRKSGLLPIIIIIVPDVILGPRSACHRPKAPLWASNQAIQHSLQSSQKTRGVCTCTHTSGKSRKTRIDQLHQQWLFTHQQESILQGIIINEHFVFMPGLGSKSPALTAGTEYWHKPLHSPLWILDLTQNLNTRLWSKLS